MLINEIFKSIQGESSFAGLPCTFVRLTGCNLRCSYCDTEYSFYDGYEMSVDEVIREIRVSRNKLVEITGGEPLIQKDVYPLAKRLLSDGYTVLIETNGSIDLKELKGCCSKNDRGRLHIIMDIKTPNSGESSKMDFGNISLLTSNDEVKFVMVDRDDYDWSKGIINKYRFPEGCKILFSPVYGKLQPYKLAEWIIEDCLPVRLQLQLHRYIWKRKTRV
ncbi:MAG: radical SAM protein [Nitrospirota bacterium]